ncbi:spore cortex-lytic enzyme [Virgibacillus sp. JSM 102003]|uniref:spore cortex-lytic enzyme n=1 Tax=Virgibacillus sp. JSM 102003 TaxID=1562108 RepID=UPI0035C0E5BE
MTYKKMFLFIIIICFFVVGLQTSHTTKPVNAFTSQVIQHGAVGDDVIELQARLQYLGFYNGNIDGVFGWGTYWALRNFQYEFGLKVDGLAGLTTRQKLVDASEYDRDYVKEQIRKGKDFTHYGGVENSKQTTPDKKDKQQTNNTNNQQDKKNNQQGANNNKQKPAEPTAANVPQGYSKNDIQLMANAVHGESRGESYVGQVAVAAVILNRVESSTFPNTVSGVIFEPRAFTAVADGQIWLTPNEQAKEAVLDAINGWDPSGNALYYFNPNTATSDWIWSRPQIKKIGKHIFAK